MHASGEAMQFYQSLRGEPVKVGIEASGNTRWFERLLEELGHELVMGDAARIRAMVVRRQKTDARDANHLMQLLEREQFPEIWVPSAVERDLRQLVLHRQKLVQMRTRIKNQLQHVALNEGLQKKRQLWTARGRQWLEDLSLPQWTERRREDLLKLLDELNGHSASQKTLGVRNVNHGRPHPGRPHRWVVELELPLQDSGRARALVGMGNLIFLGERNGASLKSKAQMPSFVLTKPSLL